MFRVILSILLIVVVSGAAYAEDPRKLERIVVTPSRIPADPAESSRSVVILDQKTLRSSVYTAIPDAIGNIGGIDIRRRGPENVQADINIRGTTFEQNTVLLDGVRMNDPQTGHFNMDVPITAMDVDRIEVLKGPASSIYGPNAFGGAINIITKRPAGQGVQVSATGGSYDYFNGGLSVTVPLGAAKNRFSVEESRSTGYMPETQFDIFSLSNNTLVETSCGVYNFLFGYMYKDFGAADFYSNLYPNEKERTDTRLFKLDGSVEKGNLRIEPRLFLRRHWDKFALDSNRPGWQTNYHTAYDYGGEITFTVENRFLDVACGYELSADTIDSTNLQTHSRTNDGLYVEILPHLAENLYLNIGMREDYSTDFGWQCSPSVSASCALRKDLILRMLIGRAYRVPTFTDLYYNDAANRGSADLKPESSWSYEAGLDYRTDVFSCSGTFFHRDSRDTIDWTRYSSRDRWQASNTGSAETNGFESSLAVMPERICKAMPVKRIYLDYTALDTYAKHDYFSKYALDYLKQQISAGLECELFGFKNSWVLNYKKRIGNSGYIVTDIKVSKDIVNKGKVVLEAFLEISNLFDVDYSEQSGIQMPGRWIRSGARFGF